MTLFGKGRRGRSGANVLQAEQRSFVALVGIDPAHQLALGKDRIAE